MIARTSFYTKNFFEKVRNQLKFFKSKIKKEKLKHTQNSIKKKIMNSLYINRSVSVTSENYKIKKIISYLNDTASEFEMMEKEIQKTIS